MRDWPPLPADEELERADDLLGQADALLGRHRAGRPADMPASAQGTDEASSGASADFDPSFDDDLPILTEVVEASELPPDWAGQAPPPQPPAPPPPAEPAITLEDRIAYQIAERLIDLDTQIARSINDWMDREFPQLLQRELDRLGERLQVEMQAHLRATLLPELSAHVSRQMERDPDAAVPPPLR
ncbi:hypothetical protein [Thauera linaloolentis]|uniref:Uncharacterized protein n=1 Tax=Thauera linaloolentis (strain DSM 12138 / JCM 21573 / CCUG 41526 / CIP 105981 / IAM 15112 / NBRC 102519 / 47Lol) TaxID=1123367 RepID=N6Z2B9_THAL4|nr:hypothetical protein [Thauera linaloolentis]ENO86294.1 hypothetical protein C666_13500 [Thauera linaloolentis 47Lol = DSM 12138]MCM8567537.1 hypothetical protein [Thauera linaloolentis]